MEIIISGVDLKHLRPMHPTNTTDPTALRGATEQGSHLVVRRSAAGKFLLSAIVASMLALPGISLRAQGSPFDGIDLGSLDLGNLVAIHEEPLAMDALDRLRIELPLDLSGENPVIVLLIDPDGNPATDDSFALPIQLSDLLQQEGDGLLGLIGIGDDILSLDDLDLIPGLSGLLDGLLGGLLGPIIGGGGGTFSLGDIVEDLNDAVISAVGLDLGSLVGYTLTSTFQLIGLDRYMVVELKPDAAASATIQPDVTVGRKPNVQRGNNVYSGGTGQTLRIPVTMKKSGKTKVHFAIENDGNATDVLTGRSRLFGAPRQSKRAMSRGVNVTGTLRAGSFRANLAPKAKVAITVTDQANRKAKASKQRRQHSFSITAKSTSDPSKFDRAEAILSQKGKKK